MPPNLFERDTNRCLSWHCSNCWNIFPHWTLEGLELLKFALGLSLSTCKWCHLWCIRLKNESSIGLSNHGEQYLGIIMDLQLAILREQVCLSMGYNLRFIGQASVMVILQKKRTSRGFLLRFHHIAKTSVQYKMFLFITLCCIGRRHLGKFSRKHC